MGELKAKFAGKMILGECGVKEMSPNSLSWSAFANHDNLFCFTPYFAKFLERTYVSPRDFWRS
jgi:hypothetical protein